MNRRIPFALLVAAAALACGDDAGPSPEQLETREVAARQACISERLALRAIDELETLEALLGATGPVGFQRAYEQHATLRNMAFAQLDSAMNRSPTSQDSLRHDELARRIQIRIPAAESVEENVIRSYESNFAAIFNDPDHVCNWGPQLERRD